MEILAVDKQMWEYITILVLIAIFALIFLISFIGGVFTLIDDFNWKDVVGTIISLVIATFATLIFIGGIITGADIQYKAKVTDFNKVYEDGYKIVGKEGNLYILEKE